MALIAWAEATGLWVLSQAEQPPPGVAEEPPGGFGNPTTLLLLLLAAGFFWWNMRRRRAFEERLRQQRRDEAIAHAEQSAQNVAHIMRQRASPEAAAAAASEGLASAARIPAQPAREAIGPEPGVLGASAATEDDVLPSADVDHARAAAWADRAAAEQAEQAAQLAERRARAAAMAGEVEERRTVAAASAAAEEARADTAEVLRAPAAGTSGDDAERVDRLDAAAAAREAEQVARDDAAVVAEARANEADALRTGVVPGATGALEWGRDATESLRAGLRELESEIEAPIGAIAGDGSAICPPEFPVKGSAASKIYHLPGQGSYPGTVAELCFASAEAAEAAGFQRAGEERAPG